MAYPNSDLTIPFATVFTTFLLWFVSLTPIRIAQSKQEEGYDNSRPREQYSRLPEWGQRAVAASNNTFEGLCFFSIAVFTYAFSQLSDINDNNNSKNKQVRIAADFFCIAFVIFRAIYFPLYWYNLPSFRSFIWLLSILCVIGIFIISFV
ncbi:membrane-associated, eicosanoid/glutathione metabolism protein [Gigaspora rosea]|uniref:Membrane-associated, eicosanoid/glutathione metabolism protein n=1 Tax=Gigaspora rosea TaxID=44941 RepID=A0A397U5L1_9GLOM|nr:membrane-associated, eicosanoid/glutathione metabolism protein [Gigaspora rosea]